jgi:hypothetical protein
MPFIATTPDGCVSLNLLPIPDLTCRAGWALDFTSSTAPAAAPRRSSILPGSTLTSTTEIFNWNTGVGVSSYQLSVGTTQGASNIYAGSPGNSLAAIVTNLPTDGSKVWVRLSSNIGRLAAVDYSYTAAGGGTVSGDFIIRGVVYSDGFGTQNTAPFDASPGDLLVAFVSSSGPDSAPETMAVTGGGLTWTLASRANGQFGTSEVWSARVTTAQQKIVVTSTPTLGTPVQSLVVVTFGGAEGIGATGSANAPNGAPSVSLTTTRAGSLVYGVGNDWNGDIPRTLGPGQTMVHEYLNPGNDTYWVQTLTDPVAAPGMVAQLSDVAPIDHMWNFAAVEVVPVSKATPTVTWTTPADILYGTPLGGLQLNAIASVPGTFVYTPPAGTVRPRAPARSCR